MQLAYTILLMGSILCAVYLIKYSYKRRTMPGANYFILLLYTAIIYNGAYIGEINATNFSSAMMWFHIEHIAIPIQHYFWLMMCLEYVRLEKKYLQKMKYIMLYHPIAYYIIYYTNDIHHGYISSYRFVSNGHFLVILSTKEYLFILMVISGTFLGIVATLFYLRGWIKTPRNHRSGYIVMIVASLFPWLSVYLNATNYNYMGIDYFPVTTIISGFLYVLGIFRYRFFHTIPIATEMVFRQAKEGILVLDINDCIIDANDTLIRIYPELAKISKKCTLSSFVSRHPEWIEILNGNCKFDIQYRTKAETRYYSVETNGIMTDNLQIGKIITISDVTAIYEHRKMLEEIATNALDKAETNEMSFLQAQISPHFINNTLSVIASMITRAPVEAKGLITDLGDYLANCYYVDSDSAMVLLKEEMETVKTYVNIEKARFRERLDFEIICKNDIPEIYVPRLVLQPLVENAIRHGILKKVEGGIVKVIITRGNDRIYFKIEDNGVGMTEEEINTLTNHNYYKKSIGIINIHKRLLRYYEDGLTIKSNIGQGTAVTFSIPINHIGCKEVGA